MVLSDLDRSLLNRCLAGADGAWEQFVDRYLALITHVVTSAGRIRLGTLPGQWRDDLVAEVLLTLVDNDFAVLRQFRGQSSLGTYLVVIARRVAVRKLSKMRRGASKSPSVGYRSTAVPLAATDEQLAFDDSEEVRSIMQRMPEEEATAIRMFHLEHKSYGDIGRIIGMSENSVGPLLTRARARMRSLAE